MSSNMPPAAKKIQLILDWTWYQKQKGNAISHKFNTEYVEFLYHVLDRDGRLSTADMKKLDNIIHGFRMHLWQKKPYYPLWEGKAPTPVYTPPQDSGYAFVSDDDDDDDL